MVPLGERVSEGVSASGGSTAAPSRRRVGEGVGAYGEGAMALLEGGAVPVAFVDEFEVIVFQRELVQCVAEVTQFRLSHRHIDVTGPRSLRLLHEPTHHVQQLVGVAPHLVPDRC